MISGREDIARVIERTIAPYIDHGNVALQHDELRDECWFKVAKLLTSCSIDRCGTRQQFFGLVKVSLRNHVRSLVHKHAFTIKRTGSSAARKGTTDGPGARKAKYVRLDDPDELFELAAESNAEQISALAVDFASMLPSPDRLLLQKRMESDEEIDPTALGKLRRRFEQFLRA